MTVRRNKIVKLWEYVEGALDCLSDNQKKNYYKMSAIIILLYKLLIDFVYVEIIAEVYFTSFYADFNLMCYLTGLLAVIILIIPMIYLYLQDSISSIIVVILNLIWFIPITTLYGFSNLSSYTFALATVYWGTFMVCQIKMPIFEAKLVKLKKFSSIGQIAFVGLGIMISLAVVYVWVIYADFRLQLSLFEGVYDIREESTTYETPLVITILLSFSTIVLPLLLLFCLKNKYYFSCLMLGGIIFMDFSIGANKATLFYGILAVVGYLFYRRNRVNLFAVGLAIIASASTVIYFITNNYTIVSLFIRRAMFVPADLTENYLDFFTQNSHSVFIRSLDSMSLLGLEPVYEMPYTEIIGLYNASGSNANNGMVSDAFLQLGLVGVVVYPIILVIILRVIDFFGNNLERKISVFIAISISVILISTGWTSFILGGELFIVCGILYVLSISNEEDRNEI